MAGLHQFATASRFADARWFDFDDRLARQDLDGAGWAIGRRCRRPPPQRGAEIESKPIVQGERIAFVLDENAGPKLASGWRECASIPG